MLHDTHLLDRVRTFAFVLVVAWLWMILTPYPGITHDGQGYALQAMQRLSPDVFGDDIFLRFQSQDDFTVFPLLQAAAIRALDLDRGTALLTFVFQVAWFVSAWLVLRQLLARPLAMLSLGLLVVVPGYYGAMRIFQFAEPFLTARLPAEALSLLAIALYLRRRWLLSGLALLVALLLHPLMAFPAVLLLGILATWERWGARAGWASVALVGVGAILVSALLQTGQQKADASWIELLRGRSPHLFLDLWTPLDWSSAVQVLATLAVVAACTRAPLIRRVVTVALAVGIIGLILAAAASLWPQLELLLKGQPWRWLWLSRLLAIAMLPAAVAALWAGTGTRRAAALLLISSWLIVLPISARSAVTQAVPGMLALVALGLTVARDAQVSPRLQTLSLRGAWVVCVFVVIAAGLTTSLVATMQFADTADPSWLLVLSNIVNMTAPAVGIVVAAWYITISGSRSAALAVLAVAVIAIMAISPWRAPTWTTERWSGAARTEFADWRQQIPAQSEVLWWDGLREVWFLLQRRSYLTDSQAGGIVFSPDLVLEIERRARNVETYLPAMQWLTGTGPRGHGGVLTAESLRMICRDPQLGFVVAEEDLGTGAPSHLWPARKLRVFLYDCGQVRARQLSPP
ncbi:MAG TPA: hypothetical protein PLE54_07170 [Burkholderiaceae bacterium]|nr:hypothetical protein [Burkholderiaceae bacterium]